MDINFNYIHVSASERLEEFTSKRLNKLKDRYSWIVRAEVYFKKENTSSPESGMICEIEISAPGQNIFTSSNEKNFEVAISKSIDELKRQLQKKKEKMTTH
ncbi:ribosome hibernation-promoting factor, HPF/YfiA family [Flavobacterium sp. CS20]|uniref:ribosome hibernation-promoting factor, HPF/YfiA family n=1 Tax=Flavobacterium sp. CS20 TaxID=2775246 RepID=UPI001B3A7867|nr:ribosome-associated translation inhibitor RaiA [Flavobacterium sp. CS20]QTY27713.1 ribosome-associated translation inhibitor RaiA [Flavobacterium sp. CS20]